VVPFFRDTSNTGKFQQDFIFNILAIQGSKISFCCIADECSPWETDKKSASHITCLLWNMKVNYYVHKGPSLVHISISWARCIQSTPSLPISLRSILVLLSSHLCLCILHAPPIFHDVITWLFGEAYKLWSSSFCNLLQPPATSS